MPEGAEERTKEPASGPATVSKVFLSYASQDAALANALCDALEVAGFPCWIAPRDVRPGDFYADAIVQAITQCPAFVLILSQLAIDSPHVLREVERASSKRRPIITFRIDTASLPPGLEYFLSASQWLDASGGHAERQFPTLIEAVRGRGKAAQAAPRAMGSPPPVSRKRVVAIAILTAVVAVVLAYVIADKFWLLKHSAAVKQDASSVSPPAHSVAVLPFVDMSEKKDQEYFSDGMSEELIDMLTKIPGLRVPARTSSFYFKGKPATISDIAKALSVLYVLEGSVRKGGNTLRVTAQLIRVDDGYHIWSETYDRQLDDVFKVQDEVAGSVVKALKMSLLGGALPASTGTENVEAYNLYLQARSIHQHVKGESDSRNVVAHLRQALKLDPAYAAAWALLSDALSNLVEEGYEPASQMGDEPRHAAEQAIKVGPRVADGYVALARILIMNHWDLTGAQTLIRQALNLDDTNQWALSWEATLTAMKGQFEQSFGIIERSIASDPVNPYRVLDLAEFLYYAGKYSDAVVAQRRVLELDPGDQGIHCDIARDLQATGDAAGALVEVDHITDKMVRDSCVWTVIADDALGRKTEANALLSNIEKEHGNENACDIARVYASRGDSDQALRWLDRAQRQHDYQLLWMRVDPLLMRVRSDPRFTDILKKMHVT